jgi:hypothetical protein
LWINAAAHRPAAWTQPDDTAAAANPAVGSQWRRRGAENGFGRQSDRSSTHALILYGAAVNMHVREWSEMSSLGAAQTLALVQHAQHREWRSTTLRMAVDVARHRNPLCGEHRAGAGVGRRNLGTQIGPGL